MAEDRAFRDGDLGFAVGPALTRITLFGDFILRAPDGSIVPIANRRARAILAMISLDPDRPIARETLTKFLWPGRFEAQAKASLRQCLLELNKILEGCGCQILSVTRDRVGLVDTQVQTDLGDLEQALVVGDVELAKDMLHRIGTKPLLDQLPVSDGFDQWLIIERQKIASQLSDKIAETVAGLRRAGNRATAAKLEEAWASRKGPSNSVKTPASPIPPLQGRTRIAVLPFHSIGAGDGEGYFADGIVDEMITSLGRVPQLLVAGRTSSFHFQGSDLASPAIAEALGVAHLIEGSVQRQGEKVRIFVRLIDGMTGFESWGQRYDGTLDDIFALQETVAQAVTAALGENLGIAMQPPVVHGLTQSKRAYDLYLQGRALNARLFGDGVLTRAAELLEEAVALDPGFAEAWVLLGDVHQRMGIYLAGVDQTEASAKMADCVRKAMAIKPGLGLAHGLLALHQLTQNNFVGALDLAFQGYSIEPQNPAVAIRLGGLLLFCGLTRQGMRYVNEAVDQDPADGRNYMMRSAGALNLGNVNAAIADGQRCVDLGFPSMWLGVALAAAGDHDAAVDAYQQTRHLLTKSIPPPSGMTPMSPEMIDAYWLVAAKGVCSGRAEDRETYCRTLDFLHTTMVDKEHTAITMPAVFMGYADLLFKTLGTRITLGNTAGLMSMWADIDPIRQTRQHPEFIPFAQAIGLAAAWHKYGWPDLLPAPSNR
jgi:TolB-like protein